MPSPDARAADRRVSTPNDEEHEMATPELAARPPAGPGTRGRLLIDGDWVPAADGRTFPTVDPATETPLGDVARGGSQDVDRAVRAARAAFAPGAPWRRMRPSDRGRLLHRVGDLILEHADELATLE